jgi:hypothetical protein
MKNLTIQDMYKFDRLLEEAEEMLRNTILDEESYLINYIRSYFRVKRGRL